MTTLVVRKIPWEFDSATCRSCGSRPTRTSGFLQCVHIHRGAFRAVHRQCGAPGGQDQLGEDPEVASEADAFLRQEAQHASAHRKHMLALVGVIPSSERCYDDACDAYDGLIDEHPIEFHAAYIANLEATFTPLFKVILDNRDSLFGGGDQRVAIADDVALRRGDRAPQFRADAVPAPQPRPVVSGQADPPHVSSRRSDGREGGRNH